MNKLEKYLRCPLCVSVLKKINNNLICSKSKHRFTLGKGIPILLDYPNLPMHSQKQQSYFEGNMKKRRIDSIINMKYHEVQYLERFTDNFKNIKNRLIIEVGTGSGYMAIGLAKLGAKVIACDITITNLITLKGFAKTLGLEKNLLFVCCSADKLPFKNNSFDYFVINAVLEHIPAEKEAIDEITRSLKRGGGLMITVPVKYKYTFPLLLPINVFHDKRIGHLRRYDDVSLKSKFPDFYMKRAYFTGHTIKVVKVIVNMIIKIFDEKVMEKEDAKFARTRKWSSNIIAFFIKKQPSRRVSQMHQQTISSKTLY